MGTERFKAGTQYGDLKGTAVADHNDHNTVREYVKSLGLINPDESIVGIEMWSGEVHDIRQNKPIVVYINLATGGYDQHKAIISAGQKISTRKIRIEMQLNEFFGLFKRFSITLSNDGLLEGKEILTDE